jgi:phosphatidate cytidylyltransferase
VIASSAIPALIVAIASAWIIGFGLVTCLRLRPHLKDGLRSVPTLMFWQLLIIAGVSSFVLLPHPFQWLLFLLAAARMVFESTSLHRNRWGTAAVFSVVLSPLLPLALFAAHVGRDASAAALFIAFFLAEAFDSFSLLGGRILGNRLMAPQLSPNKTWEGFLTGSTAALFIAVTLSAFAVVTVGQAFLCTAATIVFAPLGDLAASFGKRLAGVKDYPVLIESQGGLLDMFDSWIYAAPVTALFLQIASG